MQAHIDKHTELHTLLDSLTYGQTVTTVDWIKTRTALIAALTLATIAGLCALALHPALYPSDATDTGDLT